MRGVQVNRAYEVHVPVLQDDFAVVLDDLIDVLIVVQPNRMFAGLHLIAGSSKRWSYALAATSPAG